ncbi:MAG: hypothetical protein WAM28_00950 [Chlamydiales bacterium]
MSVFGISRGTNLLQESSCKKTINIYLSSEVCSPHVIVKTIASIDGPVDIYCWYEGTQGLPKAGAIFMKESVFSPLYTLKKDIKLYLNSLKAWDFKNKVAEMPSSSPIGDAINRINSYAVECIYTSQFFKFCENFSKESKLCAFINNELPKKEWLFNLSADRQKSGYKVSMLFDNQLVLYECISDLDVYHAYALMQYVEGYYLIQKSIKNGLLKGQKKIEIAFVLPNDEGKYYQDLPMDIEEMLYLDFGKDLSDVEINIAFHFFQYGESLASRPYIDKSRNQKVKVEEIDSYFDFLPKRHRTIFDENLRLPFMRDVIHKFDSIL